jgi:PhnB protein
MRLQVYLTFDGTCEEALRFYAKHLDGKFEIIQRFGDAPGEIPAVLKDRVLHAQFKADGISFMASDAMPGDVVKAGNITLSLDVESARRQTRIFEALSDGGQVTMPLEETFWKARFGMVVDRYGIPWMLNHNLSGHKDQKS